MSALLTTNDNRVVFEISNDYRWVLASALLNLFVAIIMVGMGGSTRAKHFPEDKMKEKFGQMHTEAGKGEIKKGGFPDHSNGRYTMEMGYETWYKFAV